MARIAGRSTWFSWFVGILCSAVLLALIYLAAPMGPAIADWTIRTVTSGIAQFGGPQLEAPALPTIGAGASADPVVPADCEGLYPAELRAQLSGEAKATMSGGAGEVLVAVPGISELLGAKAVLDCVWATPEGGRAQTLLATVAEGAPGTAGELLRAVGFTCADVAGGALGGVQCVRETPATAETAATVETHVIRGTIWVATVTTGWQADGIVDAVGGVVWPAA